MDRTRASDTERERVVEVLRDAAANGRIGYEELDERSAAAYAAATRSELAALIHDLPQPRRWEPEPRPEPPAQAPRYRAVAPPPWVRPWPDLRPMLPGAQMFSARWKTPADPREAGRIITDGVLPIFEREGFAVVHRTDDKLMLQNERGDTVHIEMAIRRDHTETHIWGVAPRGVRQGLARHSKSKMLFLS